MDNQPISSFNLGHYFQVDGVSLQLQYKKHLSDYHQWAQKEHAKDGLLFEENLSPHLSIDETALLGGELYTIVTNKAAKGRKGSIVAMVKGTQAEKIIEVLYKIQEYLQKRVIIPFGIFYPNFFCFKSSWNLLFPTLMEDM